MKRYAEKPSKWKQKIKENSPMKTKVLFLDIDGTLVDFQGKIPESAKEALIRAKERGHHLVLCTGRTRFSGISLASGLWI